MYITATNRVVSVVLVVERPEEGKAQMVQRPVYYLSEVLSLSKQNYPHYQKLVHGVYMAAKKLKNYFQEHSIRVVALAPLASVTRTPLAAWLNGPSSSLRITSNTSRALQSSRKHWLISSLIGRRHNTCPQCQT